MPATILSALLLILMLVAFGFGLYRVIKRRKSGGCSGCGSCPHSGGCDKKP